MDSRTQPDTENKLIKIKQIEKEIKQSTHTWVRSKTQLLHPGLFEKGFVVTKSAEVQSSPQNHSAKSETPPEERVSNTTFGLKERTLHVYDGLTVPTSSDLTQEASLKNKKLTETEKLEAEKRTQTAKELFAPMINFAQAKGKPIRSVQNQIMHVYNPKRRDEVFLPLVYNDGKEDGGMYIFPWHSKNEKMEKFTGFDQIVMAGCMAGASIEGLNDHNGRYALIKHDIPFYPEEKVVAISTKELFHPYEEMLFFDLQKLKTIALDFASAERKPALLYHLPYYDYMLFGVELYLRGRITYDALDHFFNAVLSKKQQHETKIREILGDDVDLTITSPFENLFGSLDNITNITQKIFEVLDLPREEINPTSISKEAREANEKDLVNRCLEKLKTNSHDLNQREVWIDFSKVNSDINNLEELFKIANSVAVGVAAKNRPNHKTCCIQSLSEKEIQRGYETYSKGYQETLTGSLKERLDTAKQGRDNLKRSLDQEKERFATIRRELVHLNDEVQIAKQILDPTQSIEKNIQAILQEKMSKVAAIEQKGATAKNDTKDKKIVAQLTHEITKYRHLLINPVQAQVEHQQIILTCSEEIANKEIEENKLKSKIDELQKTFNETKNRVTKLEKDLSDFTTSHKDELKKYPVITNLSYIDPLVAYYPGKHGSQGLPFYYPSDKSLTKLLPDLLQKAFRNVGLFATSNNTDNNNVQPEKLVNAISHKSR